MLVLKLNEKTYPLEFNLPAEGGRHSLVMRDPETSKILAFLNWDADTNVILTVQVNRDLCRNGIATALLATARQREAVRHSPQRTDDGEAWARSLGERLPKRVALDGAYRH